MEVFLILKKKQKQTRDRKQSLTHTFVLARYSHFEGVEEGKGELRESWGKIY